MAATNGRYFGDFSTASEFAARVSQLFWAIWDKLSSRTNITNANMLSMLTTFISGQGQIGEMFFMEIRNRRLDDRFALMSAIYWNHRRRR